MSCGFDEDVTAYADGELPPARARALEAHLPGCTGCRAGLAQVRALTGALAALPPPAQDPAAHAAARRAVLTRVQALPPPLAQRLAAWLRPAVLLPAGGLAAAAALAALLVVRPGAGGDEDAAARTLAGAGPGALEVAEHLELAEDLDLALLDTAGLDAAADLELVAQLHTPEADAALQDALQPPLPR